MTPILVAPRGGATDIAFHKGRIVVVWQDGPGPNAQLIECSFTTHGDPVSTIWYRLGSDVGAFPRVLSASGSLWLLYREGASLGGCAVLCKDGVEVWRSSVAAGGNDCCCFGHESTGHASFAWQKASPTNDIMSALVGWPAAQLPEGDGRPTGLSHIAAGHVILVDEARGSVPGITRPSWAGALVIGEHPDAGALVRHADGRVLHLWPGEDAYVPRLAHDAQAGLYAAVTHGRQGIRLAVFTEADLALPVPVPTVAPWPPGHGWTRLDAPSITTAVYWLGHGDWARSGAHVPLDGTSTYSHLMQSHWPTPDACQHTKVLGDGARGAVWTCSSTHIGLAYDGTNEMGGYRLVLPDTTTTAPLYPRLLLAGRTYRQTVDVLNLQTGTRDRVVWVGWLDGVYDGPALGDVPAGRYASIGWTFDREGDGIDGDPNGVIEYTLCREGHGPVVWTEVHRRTNAIRRWVGVRTTARVSDPVARFADSRPADPVIVPVPPVEPAPMSWYNDADATAFGQYLEAKYTGDMGRDRVDLLGWVRWVGDWMTLRENGWSPADALRTVNTRINAIVGLPADQWPAGVERPVDPFR